MSDPFFWMVFFSAALALNLSPGPDLLYVFSRTLSGGRRIGIISACGVCSGARGVRRAGYFGDPGNVGAGVHCGQVRRCGLSALPGLPGAALGRCRRNADAQGSAAGVGLEGLSTGRSGRPAEPQGGDLLHGLPAAVRAPEHGAVPLQLLVLGVLVVVVAIVVECALVLLAARATTALRSNPAVSQWLDALGSILIGLGIRLGLSERI